MEVDEEVDSKKKLDQRRNELQKQLRKIKKFTDVSQSVVDEYKEKWQQDLHHIEQRRNDLLPGASENAEKITKAAKLARQKEAVPEGCVRDCEKANSEIQERLPKSMTG